jgi:hypothetical protein
VSSLVEGVLSLLLLLQRVRVGRGPTSQRGSFCSREKPTLPSTESIHPPSLSLSLSLLSPVRCGAVVREKRREEWLHCIALLDDAAAGVAGDAAGDALLPGLRRPPGVPAQRVQHVLLGLQGRALLLLLQSAPTRRPQGHPGSSSSSPHPRQPNQQCRIPPLTSTATSSDTSVFLPRRGPRLRGGGRPRHHRRPDLRHQQRPCPLPQRAPAAARRRGGRGKGRRVPVQL